MSKEALPLRLGDLAKRNNQIMQDSSLIKGERQKFYYYTQKSTACKILNGSADGRIKPHFRISSLAEMNDEQECAWHEKEKNSVYALCFSHTDSESIPMWYLYSGISGEGIRIGITPLKMEEFIKRIHIVFPIYSGRIDMNRPLYLDEDFTLEYGWVYYLGHKNIAYRNTTYERQEADDDLALEKFKNNNFFAKDYEWNYEKEFRIVFHLVDSVQIDLPKQVALFFDKDEMMKRGGGLSAMMAPELENVAPEILAKELGLPERKITKSNLKIRMNLINRNRNSIVEHFEKIVDGIDSRKELVKMRNTIQKKSAELESTQTVETY